MMKIILVLQNNVLMLSLIGRNHLQRQYAIDFEVLLQFATTYRLHQIHVAQNACYRSETALDLTPGDLE